MSLEIQPYSAACAEEWDAFCADAENATLLHTRRFLAYHGERFLDASVLLRLEGRIVGVFPAAQSPQDSMLVVSHPGATYGGIVHHGRLGGQRMIDAFDALRAHYASGGAKRILYKALPHIYARIPAQDDLYALSRAGAQRVRCDLSSAIDLADRRRPGERRRRALRKAQAAVTLSADPVHLPGLWAVLAENLLSRHDAKPVHEVSELMLLMKKFPEQIRVRTALCDGKVVAGIVLFNAARVWHAQYIASSPAGQDVNALDAVFDRAITDATEAGARYFDFGISNERGGTYLNDGLYRFKSEFGGGGVVHEFYELNLNGPV